MQALASVANASRAEPRCWLNKQLSCLVGCRLLFVGCRLSFVGCWLLVAGCLFVRLFDCLVGRSDGWLVGWLIGRLGRLGRLSRLSRLGRLVVSWLVGRWSLIAGCWVVGLLGCWAVGLLGCWAVGLSVVGCQLISRQWRKKVSACRSMVLARGRGQVDNLHRVLPVVLHPQPSAAKKIEKWHATELDDLNHGVCLNSTLRRWLAESWWSPPLDRPVFVKHVVPWTCLGACRLLSQRCTPPGTSAGKVVRSGGRFRRGPFARSAARALQSRAEPAIPSASDACSHLKKRNHQLGVLCL